MPIEYRIRVSPNGKEVVGLYSDKLPYREVGPIETSRASDVFFDPDCQMWRVCILSTGEILHKEFFRREDAIAYEVQYLQSKEFPGFSK